MSDDVYDEEIRFLEGEADCTCGHAEILHFHSDEDGVGECMLACCCTKFVDANPPPPPPPREPQPGDERRASMLAQMNMTMDAIMPAIEEQVHKQVAYLEFMQRGQPPAPPVVHEKTGAYCLAHYETHSTGQCIKCRCGAWVRPQNWDQHTKE